MAYQEQGIGSNAEEAMSSALRDISSAVDLYQARFTRNIAATGEAFYNDALVTGDLTFCGQMATRATGQ